MNYKSPFKDKDKFIQEINKFLQKYGSVIIQHAKKISTYFEISCYNYIVKYYENSGFTIHVENLSEKDKSFRYKLGPLGHPKNFSYFVISKTYNWKTKKTYQFEIRHNIPIQSKHSKNIFITPDIVICKSGVTFIENKQYYLGTRILYFLPNEFLISFAEAKHYNPFPEMIVSFIGVVNELIPSLLKKKDKLKKHRPTHIAPSLMISGKGNFHTHNIKTDLQNRYSVNIFLGIFSSPGQVYSKSKKSNIVTI